ncbi:MAG: AAA domain-containing protein [Planctomycetes bacterium]|jgi:MoxR-like ATPase|nr:AAA domain-containing protein [Planctomycetota bacterium]
MGQGDFGEQVAAFEADCDRIVEQLRRVIVGNGEVIDQVLACLLAGGHVLLEGVPGIGKTLLVRTLGEAMDLGFHRIQFTPDLMPADITGTNVVETTDAGKQFRFQPGPIFANLVLADEINRATPKTQSAVLEAMQEQTVSAGRTTHPLPQPFMVLATQNPIEMEGTYPLPEAQLDRFMLKVNVTAPSADELASILDRTTGRSVARAEPVVDAERIEAMKALVRQVPAAADVTSYAARLVTASHPDGEDAPPLVGKYVRYGASPRAAQAMMLAARVAALHDGRANVAYDDIAPAVAPALRHRLILNFEAQADGIAPQAVIDDLLAAVRP